MNITPCLILTMGLPRSGKSTWARQQNAPMVNPDAIRLALTGQRYVADAEPMVWAIAKYMVRSLFLAGHFVVILDATNMTHARRDQWLSKDWNVYLKFFETGPDECKKRAVETGQEDLLPIIDRMHKDYQPVTDTTQWRFIKGDVNDFQVALQDVLAQVG